MRLSNDVVRKAIARGVQNGLFGYATGRPILGEHGRYQLDWSRIAFERNADDDEIDLDSVFLIVPKALPEKPVELTTPATGGDQEINDTGTSGGGKTPGTGDVSPPAVEDEHEVAFSFIAEALLHECW